jgi:DNA invertase Pin-like site-specific DNA recombinase
MTVFGYIKYTYNQNPTCVQSLQHFARQCNNLEIERIFYDSIFDVDAKELQFLFRTLRPCDTLVIETLSSITNNPQQRYQIFRSLMDRNIRILVHSAHIDTYTMDGKVMLRMMIENKLERRQCCTIC